MALQSAIQLGIPNTIHRHGGAAMLSELHATLPVAASKRHCIYRLMRFLAASGIFREETLAGDGEAEGTCYSLTAVSRLLVVNDRSDRVCLLQLILLPVSLFHFKACQSLSRWLQEDGLAGDTPFKMAHGTSLFGIVSRHEEFGKCFSEAMACDSRFIAEIVVRECTEVFAGLTSLVDVGGGDGTMMKAIAREFPHIRCSVLERPRMVDAAPIDCTVEFVPGDMFEFIPPADAVLLKLIMHNWSDDDCVRILKRAKEAISTREAKGKVIIIDVVVGSQSKQTLEAQLLTDLCMMTLTTGEERDEEKWHKIFLDAGFTQYEIAPVLGYRSLIEVYP